eukprot:15451361-Alexandrium_andersonii.AAC.1
MQDTAYYAVWGSSRCFEALSAVGCKHPEAPKADKQTLHNPGQACTMELEGFPPAQRRGGHQSPDSRLCPIAPRLCFGQ